MNQWEQHAFAIIHTDRYGRTSAGMHYEHIHVNATHLVLIQFEPEAGEFPYFVIRAFDATEATDTLRAHQRGEIWTRQRNRSFAPSGVVPH